MKRRHQNQQLLTLHKMSSKRKKVRKCGCCLAARTLLLASSTRAETLTASKTAEEAIDDDMQTRKWDSRSEHAAFPRIRGHRQPHQQHLRHVLLCLMAFLLSVHYHHEQSSRNPSSGGWTLVPAAAASRIYNNIIVSNDSNEEDALLNSAHEDQHDYPSSQSDGSNGSKAESRSGSASSQHHLKGGKMRHEAGGPSTGSKDIVLSTSGSKTKIIVRKSKGSSKRSALDHRRATDRRVHKSGDEEKCSCSQQKQQQPPVVPVYVPYCPPHGLESAHDPGTSSSYFYQQDHGSPPIPPPPPPPQQTIFELSEQGTEGSEGEETALHHRRTSLTGQRQRRQRLPSFERNHRLMQQHHSILSPYSPYQPFLPSSMSFLPALPHSFTSSPAAARIERRHIYPADDASVTASVESRSESKKQQPPASGSVESTGRPDRIGELFQQQPQASGGRSRAHSQPPADFPLTVNAVVDYNENYSQDYDTADTDGSSEVMSGMSGGMFAHPAPPASPAVAVDLISQFPFPFTDTTDRSRTSQYEYPLPSIAAIPPLTPLPDQPALIVPGMKRREDKKEKTEEEEEEISDKKKKEEQNPESDARETSSSRATDDSSNNRQQQQEEGRFDQEYCSFWLIHGSLIMTQAAIDILSVHTYARLQNQSDMTYSTRQLM